MSVTIDEMAVQFSAAGVAQLLDAQRAVITKNDQIATSVSIAGQKSAVAARQIASNVASIAAVGEATVGSLKGIISQGANVAFMFGTGGAIAGAIGFTSLAIYNMFTRTQRLIEETSRKAAEELRSLAMAGNLGAIGGKYGAATMLFSGDRFAARGEDEEERVFRARKMGIAGIREEIAGLEFELRAVGNVPAYLFGGEGERSQRELEIKKAISGWRVELEKLSERYRGLIGLQQELVAEAVDAAERPRRLLELNQQLFTERNREAIDAMAGATLPGIGATRDTGRTQRIWEGMVETMREGLKKIPPLPEGLTDEMLETMRLDRIGEQIGQSFAMSIVDGFTNGIQSLFGGGRLGARIEDGFEKITGSILVGMGHMAIQVGTQSAAFLSFMETIKNAIASFLPGVGLAAAFGLIGLGAILVGLGSSMGGSGRGFGGGAGYGGGGYGGSGYGPGTTYVLNPPYLPTPANTSGVTPTAPVNVINPMFIGSRDPLAQTWLLETIKFAKQRGEI